MGQTDRSASENLGAPTRVDVGRRTMVWKFVMNGSRSVFEMPGDAIVQSVGVQNGDIVIWAEVNPTDAKRQRVFNAINTGDQLPADRLYFIGTVQIGGGEWPHDGEIVWHVYEVEA